MNDKGSDSGVDRLSWLDAGSSRRGSLWSVGEKKLSKRLFKISVPSIGVVCANQPPVAMSRSRADFMSKLQ